MKRENSFKEIRTVGMISEKKHQWSYVLDRGGVARHRIQNFPGGHLTWLNNGEKSNNFRSNRKNTEAKP